MSLREVLDCVAAPDLSWHLHQGFVTFFSRQQTAFVSAYGTVSLEDLRAGLLEWTHCGFDAEVNQQRLMKVFNGVSNYQMMFIPVSALDQDQDVRQAVLRQMLNLLSAKHLPALSPSPASCASPSSRRIS